MVALKNNAPTGIANQLHCVAVGRRGHPGVQDHANPKGTKAAKSHVPDARNEGEHERRGI